MKIQPYVVEWTGQSAIVGVDQYALQFEPNGTYPFGLQLTRAWLNGTPLTEIDPLRVPSPIVHPSRHEAAKWLANWGSKSDPPSSIFNYPKRHPIFYDPGRSPGQEETQALLEAITSAAQQPHR